MEDIREGIMARLELAYVQRLKDRHGHVRHYFRRAGFKRVTLPGAPGSEAFMRAYAAALAASERREAVSSTRQAGTVSDAFERFYASADFKKLQPQTQRTYRSNLAHFEAIAGNFKLHTMELDDLKRYLATRASSPGAASNFLKRFRQVLDVAVDEKMIPFNFAKAAKVKKAKTDGFPEWTDTDIEAFENRWPIGTKERLAFALLLYTAQRRSDVVRMGRQHVTAEGVRVRQIKTGTQLTIPLHPKLKAILDAEPKDNMTFLLTEYGKPFTVAGFGNWYAKACDRAGIGGKRAHGLRKACARRLAEAGCTAYEIIAITGHSSPKEAEPYTRAADQKHLAKKAMKKIK